MHWLYEQKKTHPDRDAILGDYVTRWQRWTQAGLTPFVSCRPRPLSIAIPKRSNASR